MNDYIVFAVLIVISTIIAYFIIVFGEKWVANRAKKKYSKTTLLPSGIVTLENGENDI